MAMMIISRGLERFRERLKQCRWVLPVIVVVITLHEYWTTAAVNVILHNGATIFSFS
jgi:hypothetical protein